MPFHFHAPYLDAKDFTDEAKVFLPRLEFEYGVEIVPAERAAAVVGLEVAPSPNSDKVPKQVCHQLLWGYRLAGKIMSGKKGDI